MSLSLECPFCAAAINAPDSARGRTVNCPSCKQAFNIQGADNPPALPNSWLDLDKSVPEDANRRSRNRGCLGWLVDFLTFRRMVAPVIIQIVFWFMVSYCIFSGVLTILFGTMVTLGTGALGSAASRNKEETGTVGVLAVFFFLVYLLFGLAQIVIGPLLARLWAEIAIVIFRINETLTDIRHNTHKA